MTFAISVISLTNGFELTEVKLSKNTVTEGGSVTLYCHVDGWWEWCTFKHDGNLCDFGYDSNDTVTQLNCTEDYEFRAEFVGDYNNYECAMELSNVKLEDAGKWTCEVESYYAGRYRGYGYQVSGEMDLKVRQKVISFEKWFQIQIVKAIRKHGIPISPQKVNIICNIIFQNINKSVSRHRLVSLRCKFRISST